MGMDLQDRTGRISFKLFDKDPSNFPGTLRTQVKSLWFIFSIVHVVILIGLETTNIIGDC